MIFTLLFFFFFFFNDTATTEIYTLSLHDALPIWTREYCHNQKRKLRERENLHDVGIWTRDRKSTRLNSSHSQISYAVFCLKKKKKTYTSYIMNQIRIQTIRHAHYRILLNT